MKTRKQKITHVLYSGLGGHGNVFFSLVDADENKEFEYSALFMGIELVKEEYLQKCAERGIPSAYVAKRRGFDPGFFFKMYRAMRKMKPDILFLHNPLNIVAAFFYRLSRFFRCKIIVRETEPNHLKNKRDWFWLFVAMFVASKIFFLSEQSRDDVKKRLGLFFFKKKTGVIPNGIDLDVFRPGNKQSSCHSFVIGMQSRLEKSKDHATLINAFALLKDDPFFCDLKLRIAGNGSRRTELEDLTSSLALTDKVEFCGMLPEQELVTFLHSLDLYIHASTGETMSTAIMQAMACRLPVIASDVRGINNMVLNGQTGVLVPVKDSNALAKAIKDMCNNKPLRDKLSETAFKDAQEKFSNRRMFLQYEQLFKNVKPNYNYGIPGHH